MRKTRWTRSTRCLVAAFGLALAPAALAPTHHAQAAAVFDPGRAINIAVWFTWPRYQAAPATGIDWPPFRPQNPRPEVAASLKSAGFDTIRLAVDPAPFIVFEGERRESIYAMLFGSIRQLRQRGLKVIVDLHPNSRHPVWGDRALVKVGDSEFFDRYVELVADMARRLKAFPAEAVALELVNEPRVGCKGAEETRWQDMLQAMISRARSGNADLTLIAAGGCASTPEGLTALEPAQFKDERIIYTFHYYEPFTFTHQGAQFVIWPDKYLDEVPWPASRRPITAPLTRLRERMISVNLDAATRDKEQLGARRNLERYYASGHDAKKVESQFALVADWARRHQIAPSRIFVGEFGVWRRNANVPGALCVDRAAWIDAVRSAAEKARFRWAFFHVDGPFGLFTEQKPPTLDPVILASLGLGPRAPCDSTSTSSQ